MTIAQFGFGLGLFRHVWEIAATSIYEPIAYLALSISADAQRRGI